MPKGAIPFEDFLNAAGAEHAEFIENLHKLLLSNDYSITIKEAKSGYVVSYVHKPTKKTVANYVFRKNGPMIRIYADNVADYMNQLDLWPEDMKASIRKAGVCKRLVNPDACNPRCSTGFDFLLDGEHWQKCRNNCFLFYLNDSTKPFLQEMMEGEVKARS